MEKTETACLVGGHKLVQTLWKTVWSFPQKLKLELPCDSAILLLGVYPGKKKKTTLI